MIELDFHAFNLLTFITEEKYATLWIEKMIVFIDFPWLVSNPVLSIKVDNHYQVLKEL